MPNSKDDWWKLFDDNKDDLRRLVGNYHPAARDYEPSDELSITARKAEKVSELIRADIRKKQKLDPLEEFDRMATARDPLMGSLLNQAWFGVPESTDCWHIPGFGVLCTLCEEADLLYEDQNHA